MQSDHSFFPSEQALATDMQNTPDSNAYASLNSPTVKTPPYPHFPPFTAPIPHPIRYPCSTRYSRISLSSTALSLSSLFFSRPTRACADRFCHLASRASRWAKRARTWLEDWVRGLRVGGWVLGAGMGLGLGCWDRGGEEMEEVAAVEFGECAPGR